MSGCRPSAGTSLAPHTLRRRERGELPPGIAIIKATNVDTSRSSIRPGSDKTLGEAASLLKVVQDERARAVAAALVQRGIAAGRFGGPGLRPDVPVADNRIEDGRAKTRRVERVKK